MDFYIALLLILLAGVIILASPDARDLFRNKPHDRRKQCLSDAMDNVRIVHGINNIEYRPLSILPLSDTTCSIDVETTKGPRRQIKFDDVHESELKHSVMNTLQTGKVQYRFTRKNLNPVLPAPDHELDPHPVYTTEELRIMSDEAFRDKTEKDGVIATLKANEKENVNVTIEKVRDLTGSKYGGGQ